MIFKNYKIILNDFGTDGKKSYWENMKKVLQLK